MEKTTTKIQNKNTEDMSFVEGLSDAINSGYLAKAKPRFTKKSQFSASNLTYGAGECPRSVSYTHLTLPTKRIV